MNKRHIDWSILNDLIDKGMNCKQIANHYGYIDKSFGKKAKEHLGIYLSQYIAIRNKTGLWSDREQRRRLQMR